MRKIIFIAIGALLVITSCKKENSDVPAEPVKLLSGNWKITKAVRNGTDLTARFDFSGFRINFSDSTYTLTNPVPFLVSKNGKWFFDDPQYPFRLSLQEQNQAAKISEFSFPVVNGVRNIIISFSPGCILNTYQYTLQPAD